MPSGGARLRSGPMPDEHSQTSERRGYKLSALPNHGYAGKPPKYPLQPIVIYDSRGKDRENDVAATRQFAALERKTWKWLWSTPQACAWSLPQFSYLLYDIALYCRQLVICETSDATSADRGLLPRFADRIGLSPAGLAALGWKIVADEIGARRNGVSEENVETDTPARRRLRG